MDTRGYADGLREALGRLDHDAIAQAVERLDRARQDGRMILIGGNGGSASTAMHFANDLNKLVGAKQGPKAWAMSLTDNVALLTAWANDLDYEHSFSAQVERFGEPDDVLVAITTSGESQNVAMALKSAERLYLRRIVITAHAESKCAEMAEVAILTTAPRQTQQEDVMLAVCHMIAESLR